VEIEKIFESSESRDTGSTRIDMNMMVKMKNKLTKWESDSSMSLK